MKQQTVRHIRSIKAPTQLLCCHKLITLPPGKLQCIRGGTIDHLLITTTDANLILMSNQWRRNRTRKKSFMFRLFSAKDLVCCCWLWQSSLSAGNSFFLRTQPSLLHSFCVILCKASLKTINSILHGLLGMR